MFRWNEAVDRLDTLHSWLWGCRLLLWSV